MRSSADEREVAESLVGMEVNVAFQRFQCDLALSEDVDVLTPVAATKEHLPGIDTFCAEGACDLI